MKYPNSTEIRKSKIRTDPDCNYNDPEQNHKKVGIHQDFARCPGYIAVK